jgi:large subunit ribosomal protein L4
MKLNVVSISSDKKSDLNSESGMFNEPYNVGLLHEVISSYRINGRSGNVAQLSRSDVRGGGAKPWRQKGTGRARAGTSNSPIWRGGGVTFASSKRNYQRKINKKVYRQALRIIFSELIRQDRLVIVDEIKVEPKTKKLLETMNHLNVKDVLFVTDDFERELTLAARNLVNTNVITVNEINPVILLQYEKICMTLKSINLLEGNLA